MEKWSARSAALIALLCGCALVVGVWDGTDPLAWLRTAIRAASLPWLACLLVGFLAALTHGPLRRAADRLEAAELRHPGA